LSRVFDLQKFGQAHGHHYEFILCEGSASSAVGSPFEPEAGWERSWKLSVGINQATTYGGVTAMSQNGGPPYHDLSGWGSIISPCGDKLIDG